MPLLKFGISACLLGDKVRYDGEHKRQSQLLEQVEGNAELLGFCPEVAAGLGIPREPIQLVKSADAIRVLQVSDADVDVTDALGQCARQLEFAGQIHGYIFKARSPSCGVGSTPVWAPDGEQLGVADGEFVAQLRRQWPELPLIDEEQWRDDGKRAAFFARALNYRDSFLKSK